MDNATDASRQCVTLRSARSKRSIPLFRVVVGGVASRANLRMDQLDDLQLAVEAIVVEEGEGDGNLELQVVMSGTGLVVTVDGLANDRIRDSLTATDTAAASEEFFLDVGMLLAALVDRSSLNKTADGKFAVRLEKWA